MSVQALSIPPLKDKEKAAFAASSKALEDHSKVEPESVALRRWSGRSGGFHRPLLSELRTGGERARIGPVWDAYRPDFEPVRSLVARLELYLSAFLRAGQPKSFGINGTVDK